MIIRALNYLIPNLWVCMFHTYTVGDKQIQHIIVTRYNANAIILIYYYYNLITINIYLSLKLQRVKRYFSHIVYVHKHTTYGVRSPT